MSNIEKQDLLSYTQNCMQLYGEHTIENRALPDYRDGLKPVQRRILWAMYKLGLVPTKGNIAKSARTVGDVLGKYHPHGDSAVYGTMVKMARHCPVFYIEGQGNFGSAQEPKAFAAMRYTEARLSKYAELCFFNPFYIPTIEYIPTFDGKHEEPFILPALLPNVLVNGAFGIATGTTTNIPAFTIPSLIKVIKTYLNKGKKLTALSLTSNLEFASLYGASAYLEEEYEEECHSLMTTGVGSVYYSAGYSINEDNSVSIYGFAPDINVQSAMLNLMSDEDVKQFHDDSDIDEDENAFVSYRVELKGKKADIPELAEEVASYFDNEIHYKMNITRKYMEQDEDGCIVPRADFYNTSVKQQIEEWCEYRVELERKALTYWIDVEQQKMEHQELLLLAVLNRDVILKSLEVDDSEAFLIKKLKITEQQAKVILDLKVRQLKKLEENQIKDKIKSHKKIIKQYKLDHKNPTDRIVSNLLELMKVEN